MAGRSRTLGVSLITALTVLVAAASADAAVSKYIGPRVGSAADAPFTALVETIDAECTGSILDASRILTAAHCVYGGAGQLLTPSQVLVAAGTDNYVAPEPPPDWEVRPVGAIRVHPAYNPAIYGLGDVAILQLTRPLTINGAGWAIGLVGAGPPPTVGSVMRGFGWGIQNSDGTNDQYEHTVSDMTVQPTSTCAKGVAGVFCIQSPTGASCHGDSGGPIVSSGGLLAGSVSYGISSACGANFVNAMVDLSTPAIAQWISGSDSPPAMPYTDQPATLAPPPLTGGAATCTAPAWTGAPALTTVFVHVADRAVVQEGPSTTYAPGPADAGKVLGCRSHAETPGGVADMPAEGTISVQAATHSVRGAKRSASISYTGPGDLPLKLTLKRGGHTAWTKTTTARRVALPSTLHPGSYQLCADAAAAGQFASAQSCTHWRAAKRPKKRKHRG
jgi:trypsin